MKARKIGGGVIDIPEGKGRDCFHCDSGKCDCPICNGTCKACLGTGKVTHMDGEIVGAVK